MKLVITLTKEVSDTLQAQALSDTVKERLLDYPTVKVRSQVTESIEPPPD